MPPIWVYVVGMVIGIGVAASALVLRDAGYFDAVPILLGFFATNFFIDLIKLVARE